MENLVASNLVIITYDQLRFDHTIGGYGRKIMPFLNKIGSAEISLKNCYVNSPCCIPSRLSLLTGEYPSRYKITRNEEMDVLPGIKTNFNKNLKGYTKNLIGKTHWTSHYKQDDLRNNIELMKSMGIDDIIEIAGPRALVRIECELTDKWMRANILDSYKNDMNERYRSNDKSNAWKVKDTILPYDMYPDVWIKEKALKKIENLNSKEPWILWVSFVGPHEPFDIPEKWVNIKKDIIKPKDTLQVPYAGTCELSKQQKKWGGKLEKADIKDIRLNYKRNCRLMDNLTKEVFEKVESMYFERNVNYMITSDHGEMLGDYGMLYKSNFLEPCIKTPFIYISAPKDQAEDSHIKNKMKNADIELKDIFQAVIASQKNGGKMKQISSIMNKKLKQRDYVVVEYSNELLIKRGRKKMCINLHGEILWASKIGRFDKMNEYFVDIEKTDNWMTLKEIAKHEVKRRLRQKWIIRDLERK